METFNQLIQAETPVLIDFYADWCTPCQQMAPVLHRLKEQKGDKLRIVKLNVEKNQSVAAFYSIQSIPTLILFRAGKQLWRQSGYLDLPSLSRVIDMIVG